MSLERVIVSGGGTGGHIFPAIAIANQLKIDYPNIEILFVGAKGKMEMEKVPAAGHKIEGLWISGLQRKFSLQNFLLPLKLIASLWKSYRILKKFKPQIVVGFGGYASGPLLRMATWTGIPAVVQEQNGFPGKTNKLLASKVAKICVAYPGLEKFFERSKIVFTGNPVRSEMLNLRNSKTEAAEYFKLDPNKTTVLVIGGSLGARTLNNAVKENITLLALKDIQIIWQSGANFAAQQQELAKSLPTNIQLHGFLPKMNLAYEMADVIISRAGAISVSELCIVQKPTILVPSPNVAEDHQTKNAMILVNAKAALLVVDKDADDDLWKEVFTLIENKELANELQKNMQAFAKPNATQDIVKVIQNVFITAHKK
jgi:UDP-N-acetylglucosamine--N-acetylmuramyl-(pentapeptide) pyrophosphoryl-undecaprenol N-acetylglucosamine transferase